MHEVTIFTDGACSPNPGRGGWAAILVCNGREKELTGNDPDSTNQKMELQAVIEGLKALRFPCRVKVVTDSQGVCAWMTGVWRRKKAHIRQLCAEIEAVIEAGGHEVTYEWVRGHNGHPMNERADKLANNAIWTG